MLEYRKHEKHRNYICFSQRVKNQNDIKFLTATSETEISNFLEFTSIYNEIPGFDYPTKNNFKIQSQVE